MNSILQCLFAVPPLSEFFVSKAQVDSMLNPSNPLGTGGELAKAFCGLVKSMAGSAGKTQVRKSRLQIASAARSFLLRSAVSLRAAPPTLCMCNLWGMDGLVCFF